MTREPRMPGMEPTAAPAEHLLYLYGIVPAGSAAHRLLTERRVPGIQPGKLLFPIEAAGLVAAVSDVPVETFDEAPLNALLTDLPRLTPYALRHEEAVRALLVSALIPMTFGAIYRGPERVIALLQQRADELHDLLAALEGRQEWGLKVFTDTPRLLEAAATASDDLQRLASEAAAATPGRAYLLDKQRERLLAHEAARLASVSLGAILARLSAMSAAVVQDDTGPAQPGDEQLGLKAAFLVEDREVTAFRTAVADLERAHAAHGLRLELSGPWAPYSFVREGAAPLMSSRRRSEAAHG